MVLLWLGSLHKYVLTSVCCTRSPLYLSLLFSGTLYVHKYYSYVGNIQILNFLLQHKIQIGILTFSLSRIFKLLSVLYCAISPFGAQERALLPHNYLQSCLTKLILEVTLPQRQLGTPLLQKMGEARIKNGFYHYQSHLNLTMFIYEIHIHILQDEITI